MQQGGSDKSIGDSEEKNSSFVKEGSFKRKRNQGAQSDRKAVRFQKQNRPSERSFDQGSVSSSNKFHLETTQEENQKLMVLSNEAREALKSMQRFDRFIYVTESQKRLKIPIENELKRLEKIKNSGNKLMKNTFFDNQLTITCLFNHMKNLYEISKQLGQIVTLKAQIQMFQQKIIEMNVKFNKDLKQAANSAKGKAAEDQQTLKDTLKIIDTLIFALKQKNVDKAKRKIQNDLKRATQSRKQLLQLVHNLIGRVGGGATVQSIQVQQQGGVDIYQLNLNKLIQDQGSVQKNLIFLNSQKSFFQKSIKQSKSQEGKTIYSDLKQTSSYLIELNTTIKDTEASLLTIQKKAVGSALSEQDKQKLKRLQQLQSIVNTFEQDGDVWHKQMQVINIKIQNNQNINMDLNKNKKLLNTKKQLNGTIHKLAGSYLGLLQLSSKKLQSVNNISNIQNQNAQLLQTNQNLQNQLKKLKKQLQSSNSKEQQQVNKFINMLQQSLTLKEGQEIISLAEYQKIKKYIDLNRKKIPEQFLPTFNSIEILVKNLIDNQNFIKQKQVDDQKNQATKNKQLVGLQTILKTLQKILFSNQTINDAYLNKLKRAIEQNTQKIDKLGDNQINNLFKTSNTYIVKLLQLLLDTFKSSKSKGNTQSQFKHQLQELKNQLKNKDIQISKTNKVVTDLETKISKLNQSTQKSLTKQNQDKVQIQQYKKSIASLQKKIAELQRNLDNLEKDKLNINKKLQQSQSKVKQHQNSLKQLKDSIQKSSTEDQKKINAQINIYKNQIDEYQKDKLEHNNQIESLNQQIQQLNRRLAETSQQYSVQSIQFNNNSQQLQKLNQQIGILKNDKSILNVEIQQLKKSNASISKQLQKFKRQNEQLLVQLKNNQGGIEGDRNQINNLNTQNRHLSQQLNRVQQFFEKIKLDYQNQSNNLQQNNLNYNNLQIEYNKLLNSFELLKNESNKGNQNNLIIQQLNNQNNNLKNDIQNLDRQYGVLKNKFDEQTYQLSNLQRIISNKNSSQNQNSLELNNFKNRISDLEGRLNKAHLQNSDLHTKINSNITQISSLQFLQKNLQNQIRNKNIEIERSRTNNQYQKTNKVIVNSDYQIQRYQALKDQNMMLKEQIVRRDQKIQELNELLQSGGVSNISQTSALAINQNQQIIRRLQRQLSQIRQSNSRDVKNNQQNKLIIENRQLTQAIRIKQSNLQNALGDNNFLYKQLNRYKQIQSQLQSKISSLNRQLQSKQNLSNLTIAQTTSTSSNQLLTLKKDNAILVQEKRKLQLDIKQLQKQIFDYKFEITSNSNLIQNLQQNIHKHNQNESYQKKMIDELMRNNTSNSSNNTNIMEKKLMQLQSSIKAISNSKNNDQNVSLRSQNTQLKDKIKTLQNQSLMKRDDYSFQDQSKKNVSQSRINDLLKQKYQYIKTIKQMQSLLQVKDIKMIQLYDKRQNDLRNLIYQNKKLQDEVNKINQKLVKQKVKHLIISPQFLEQSMLKMEAQLIDLKNENVILKQEIEILEQQIIQKDKQIINQSHNAHAQNNGHENMFNLNMDKNLSEKINYLQIQKSRLNERIKLLSVYNKIDNSSQSLISNVNRLIDGILLFLNQSDDFNDCDFTNIEFLPAINESIKNQNYQLYFETVQDLFKDLFFRVVGRKNQILDKQAQQLLLLRQKMQQLLEQESGYEDDSYSKSYYSKSRVKLQKNDTKKKASLIALQHLFKLYLKAKDPNVLREISQLLTMNQGQNRSRYFE